VIGASNRRAYTTILHPCADGLFLCAKRVTSRIVFKLAPRLGFVRRDRKTAQRPLALPRRHRVSLTRGKKDKRKTGKYGNHKLGSKSESFFLNTHTAPPPKSKKPAEEELWWPGR